MIHSKSPILSFVKRHLYTISLISLIIIAIFYRFYQLSHLPPGLYQGEATSGLAAFKILHQHDFSVFYNINGPKEALFFYLQAVTVGLLGNTILALRVIPAIIGVLTMIVSFYWAKEWFGKRIAFIAAFFIAVSPWAITFSRNGYRANLVPLMIVLTLWLYTIAIRKRQLIWYILTGICLGIGFYTHPMFRFFPAALILTFLLLLIANRQLLKAHLRPISIVIIATAITLTPMVIYGFKHPADISPNITNSSFLDKNLNDGRPTQTLLSTIGKTALMFNFRGDENYRHNLGGQPMLNFFVGVMFVLGLLLVFVKIKTPKYLFLLILFFIMLLPEILSASAIPNASKIMGALPIIFVLAAIGTSYMLDSWYNTFPINSAARSSGLLAMALLIGLTAYQGYKQYFIAWAESPQTYKAFDEDTVAMANLLNAKSTNINKYVLIDNFSDQTIQYLTYGKTSYSQIGNEEDIKKLTSGRGPKIFLLAEEYKSLIPKLKQKFTGGRLSSFYSSYNDKELFKIYEIK